MIIDLEVWLCAGVFLLPSQQVPRIRVYVCICDEVLKTVNNNNENKFGAVNDCDITGGDQRLGSLVVCACAFPPSQQGPRLRVCTAGKPRSARTRGGGGGVSGGGL